MALKEVSDVIGGYTGHSRTVLEYSLLMYFYQNCNQVLTRDQILDSVWGYSYFGNTRTVDIHVLRLRRKLGLDEQIQTVFKVGYKFFI